MSKNFCEVQKYEERHQMIKWDSEFLADSVPCFGLGM